MLFVVTELVLHMTYYYLQQVYVLEPQFFKYENIELLHLVKIQIELMHCILVVRCIIHLFQLVLVLEGLVFVVLKMAFKVVEI